MFDIFSLIISQDIVGRYAAGNWHNFVHRSMSVDVLGAVSPFPDFFFTPWYVTLLKESDTLKALNVVFF